MAEEIESLGIMYVINEELGKTQADRWREMTDLSMTVPKGAALGLGGLFTSSLGPDSLRLPVFAFGVFATNFAWNSIADDISHVAFDKLADDYDPSQSRLLPGNMLSSMLRDERQSGNLVPLVTRTTQKGPAITKAQWIAQEHKQHPAWDTETVISAG